MLILIFPVAVLLLWFRVVVFLKKLLVVLFENYSIFMVSFLHYLVLESANKRKENQGIKKTIYLDGLDGK